MPLTEQHQNEFINELKTIQDVLRWTVTQFVQHDLFYGHGTDNAWDETLALICHYLGLSIENVANLLNARFTTQELHKLYPLIVQRIEDRMPLPYITNEAWFAGSAYYVDQRVLIPRSPIAELIAQNFEPYLASTAGVTGLEVTHEHQLEILEIGTGSGCIACAIAEQFRDQGTAVKVDATDISVDALEVAKINRTKHHLEHIVRFIKSDLFSSIPEKKYDVIVTNPPYVDAQEMQNLPPEFLHEPRSALAAGDDGLILVDQIIKQAAAYLKPHGILIVEVGASKPALENKYPNIAFIWPEFANGGEGVFILTYEQLIAIS